MNNKKSYLVAGIFSLIASVSFGISIIVSNKSITKNIWGIVASITFLISSVAYFTMWKKGIKRVK